MAGTAMIVEFIGGPRDGETMEVPDGVRCLRLAQSVPLRAVWSEDDDRLPPEPNFKTMTLDIMHASNGRNFVLWKEDWSG